MLTEVNIFSQLLLASDYILHDDPVRAKPAGSSNLQENMDPVNTQFSRLYEIAEVCSHLSCVPVPAEQAKQVTNTKEINGGQNTKKKSAQKRKFPEDIIRNTKTIEPVVSGKLSTDSDAKYNTIKLEDDLMTGPPIKCSFPDLEVDKCSKDKCDPIQNNINWKIKPTQMDFHKVEEDSVKPKIQPNRKRPRNTQQYPVFLEYNYALPPGKMRKMSPHNLKVSSAARDPQKFSSCC